MLKVPRITICLRIFQVCNIINKRQNRLTYFLICATQCRCHPSRMQVSYYRKISRFPIFHTIISFIQFTHSTNEFPHYLPWRSMARR
ncbi:hypothetical protein O3G_MSEX015082 [Manduca sexta]|uniref:Uncharacterized protein n=1 Tax=Manduca sexta TaxID=7130 RepID=A0A922D0Q5_MANSE|nr:hypothetical protein O3G_MSEX015082 [Manduca sexta]